MKRRRGNKPYLAGSYDLFRQSFDLGLRKISYILIVDFLFYLGVISLFLLSMSFIGGRMAAFDDTDVGAILDSQDSTALESTTAMMQGFLLELKITGVLLILAVFTLFAISAYLIWMRISGTKRTFKGFMKSIPISISFFGFFMVALFITSQGSDVANASDGVSSQLMILLWVITMASAIIFAVFAKSEEISQALKGIFKIISRIRIFILPAVISTVIGAILVSALSMIAMLFLGSALLSTVVNGFFLVSLLIYSAWFRNYIYLVIADILENDRNESRHQ